MPNDSEVCDREPNLSIQPYNSSKINSKNRRVMQTQKNRGLKRRYNDGSGDEATQEVPRARVVTIAARSYFANDRNEFKRHIGQRCEELTMKVVKKIITEWMDIAEPKRKKLYGKYDHHYDDNRPLPPWWPAGICWKEPAHICKDGKSPRTFKLPSLRLVDGAIELLPVTIALLELHQLSDPDGKPRLQWIQRLKREADRLMERLSDENFGSSKSSSYNRRMKERAIKEVLPDLFNAAQTYEDHCAMWGEKADSVPGTQYTWQPAKKVARDLPQKKYVRRHGTCTQAPKRVDAYREDGSSDDAMALDSLESDQRLIRPPSPSQQSISSPCELDRVKDVVLATRAPNGAMKKSFQPAIDNQLSLVKETTSNEIGSPAALYHPSYPSPQVEFIQSMDRLPIHHPVEHVPACRLAVETTEQLLDTKRQVVPTPATVPWMSGWEPTTPGSHLALLPCHYHRQPYFLNTSQHGNVTQTPYQPWYSPVASHVGHQNAEFSMITEEPQFIPHGLPLSLHTPVDARMVDVASHPDIDCKPPIVMASLSGSFNSTSSSSFQELTH